jgi:hypothetical protein
MQNLRQFAGYNVPVMPILCAVEEFPSLPRGSESGELQN